jgi:hypothetical protein
MSDMDIGNKKTMENVQESLHLYSYIINSASWTRKLGEIPFFISTYNAKQELMVTEDIKLLINKLESSGCLFRGINLYDIVWEIQRIKEAWNECSSEKVKSKEISESVAIHLNIHEVMPKIKEKNWFCWCESLFSNGNWRFSIYSFSQCFE